MKVTQGERKAGAGGTAFITVVVLAIVACIGLMVWRAGAGDGPNGPPAVAESRQAH
jgi:hypothetical protein